MISETSAAWSGLGTGIVTGVITGVVAFGLFFVQRRSDRQEARDERTERAIDTIKAATEQTIAHATRLGSDRYHRYEAREFVGWSTTLRMERPRMDQRSAGLQNLLNLGQMVALQADVRLYEIQMAHPAEQDGDGNDVLPVLRRDRTLLAIGMFTEFLSNFNDALGSWSPNERAVDRYPTPNPLLITPYDPADPWPTVPWSRPDPDAAST